jgi:hypothetical protein
MKITSISLNQFLGTTFKICSLRLKKNLYISSNGLSKFRGGRLGWLRDRCYKRIIVMPPRRCQLSAKRVDNPDFCHNISIIRTFYFNLK